MYRQSSLTYRIRQYPLKALPSLSQTQFIISNYIGLYNVSIPFNPYLNSSIKFESSIYHSQMYILPSVNVHLTVVHCPSVALPLPCGSATTGLWQSYHCPLNDGKVFNEKRNSLGLGMIMTKFVALHSLFTHSSVCKGFFPSILFNVIPQYQAYQWGNTRKSYWRTAGSYILSRAITNEHLRRAGYVTLMGEYLEWHPKQEPPYAERHVRWCERSVNMKVGDKHL